MEIKKKKKNIKDKETKLICYNFYLNSTNFGLKFYLVLIYHEVHISNFGRIPYCSSIFLIFNLVVSLISSTFEIAHWWESKDIIIYISPLYHNSHSLLVQLPHPVWPPFWTIHVYLGYVLWWWSLCGRMIANSNHDLTKGQSRSVPFPGRSLFS